MADRKRKPVNEEGNEEMENESMSSDPVEHNNGESWSVQGNQYVAVIAAAASWVVHRLRDWLAGRTSSQPTLMETGATGTSLPISVVEFAELLRKRYANAKIMLDRGMSFKPHRRPLNEIFVNVVVIPREELAALNEQTFFGSQSDAQTLSHVFSRVSARARRVKLCELFEFADGEVHDDESVRVLAVACAGAGKTTVFTQKGPLDWSKGLIWQEFVIVCTLALRNENVCGARNLTDLLQIQQLDIFDDRQRLEIVRYLSANPHRLLLVFDGLDESGLSACSDFVRGLIEGTELKGVRLLLTSRHSPEIMKLSLSHPFDRRVEVLGFTKENVREYVENVLPKIDANELLQAIDGNPTLSAIIQTPFFTRSMCDLYRAHASIPSSLFEIFSSLTLSIIAQNGECKYYPNWSSVPRALRECILEIGHFSFLMLAEKKVVFSDRELDAHQLSAGSRSLGLLVACEPSGFPCENQWQLSHLSIQECLAALYMGTVCKSGNDVESLVRQMGALTGHLSTFWCLLAPQLSDTLKESLIHGILTQPVPDKINLNEPIPRPKIGEFLRSSEDTLLALSEDLCTALDAESIQGLAGDLLADVLPQGVSVSQAMEEVELYAIRPTLLKYVRCMLQLWRRKVPRASVRMLCDAVQRISSPAAELVLSSCRVSVGKVGGMDGSGNSHASTQESRSVITASNFRSLGSTRNKLSEVVTAVRRQLLLLACRVRAQPALEAMQPSTSDPVLSPSLAKALCHYGFYFDNIILSSADCHVLCSILHIYHRHIQRVSLFSCQLDDNAFTYLSTGLAQCNHLREIVLSYNPLSDVHVQDICDIIHTNRNTLHNVNLRDTPMSSQAYSQIVSAMLECSNLEDVSIGGAHCVNVPLNVLMCLVLLAYRKQVSFFIHFFIGDAGLAMLLPYLLSSPVHMISFQTAGISISSAHAIGHLLDVQHRHNRGLDLRGNLLSDAFLHRIAPSLKRCTALQFLFLAGSGLTSCSLSNFADILSTCTELCVVNVSGNDFRSDNVDGTEQLSSAIRQSRNLQILWMPSRESINHRLLAELDSIASVGSVSIRYE